MVSHNILSYTMNATGYKKEKEKERIKKTTMAPHITNYTLSFQGVTGLSLVCAAAGIV